MTKPRRGRGKSDRQLLRECLAELRRTMEDIGGCDHSVNICACDLARLIEAVSRRIGPAPSRRGAR